MAAMTSFHAEKFCHLDLVSENEASAARLCSSVRQFLIYSIRTFVFVVKNAVTKTAVLIAAGSFTTGTITMKKPGQLVTLTIQTAIESFTLHPHQIQVCIIQLDQLAAWDRVANGQLGLRPINDTGYSTVG